MCGDIVILKTNETVPFDYVIQIWLFLHSICCFSHHSTCKKRRKKRKKVLTDWPCLLKRGGGQPNIFSFCSFRQPLNSMQTTWIMIVLNCIQWRRMSVWHTCKPYPFMALSLILVDISSTYWPDVHCNSFLPDANTQVDREEMVWKANYK